jgi:hypothetical protein
MEKAYRLGVKYRAVFQDVIWKNEIDELLEIVPNEFVIASMQSDLLEVINIFCDNGFSISGSVSIEDGPVHIYGIVMKRDIKKRKSDKKESIKCKIKN